MKILTTPNPFLKHKAKTLTHFDRKIDAQVKEMIEILKKTTNPKGVGLAATQVGLDLRLFIILHSKKPTIYINPKITKTSDKLLSDAYPKEPDRWLEGCLSIPTIWGFVDRHFSIEVTYDTPVVTTDGWKLAHVTSQFEDVDAAYIQHENDHLDGILFTDRIRDQKGKVFQETKSGLELIEDYSKI